MVAYELLFRNSRHAQFAQFDEVGRAAVRVIINTFESLGMDAVLGQSLGFFNVTREVLPSDAIEALPQDRVAIEGTNFDAAKTTWFTNCDLAKRLRGH